MVTTTQTINAGLQPLGALTISNDGTGYRLEIDRTCVDALRFVDLLPAARERMKVDDLEEASQLLHMAIDSWRGPALEALRDCDVAYGECVRLEELRLNAIEDCIQCDLAVGQHDRWLDDLQHCQCGERESGRGAS